MRELNACCLLISSNHLNVLLWKCVKCQNILRFLACWYYYHSLIVIIRYIVPIFFWIICITKFKISFMVLSVLVLLIIIMYSFAYYVTRIIIYKTKLFVSFIQTEFRPGIWLSISKENSNARNRVFVLTMKLNWRYLIEQNFRKLQQFPNSMLLARL